MAKRLLLIGLYTVLLAIAAPSMGMAQGSNASISGMVADPTGAAVPNAQLTLRALGIGAVSKTASSSDGLYAFPNLLSGAYDLEISASGFQDYVQKGISVNLDSKVRVDVKLQLGTSRQTVEVSANASPLNYETPEQKGTITPQTLEQLPLILAGQTRSAVAFARLLPGVTSGGDNDNLNFNTRVNGGINEGDEAVLDGVSIIDGSLGQNGIELGVTGHPFSPEAIQEITLLTANYDAQYGSTASSVLTAVTKSGTDAWHGSAYDLERNAGLNARQWGIPKRPQDIESDFGGTLGGPLKIPWLAWSGRKKSYAFANYEGFRLTGSVSAPIVSVPTMQERQGDFSDWKDSSGNLIPIYDPATTRPDPNNPGNFIRTQFMGCDGQHPNVICPSDPRLQSSLAPAWFKYLPPPNLPGVLRNYTPPRPPTNTVNKNSTVFDLRVDHYFREADHFSVNVHYFGSFGNNDTIFPKQIDSNSFRQPNYDFADRFNWDHTFRPNLLNNFNLGYNDILSVIVCSDAPFADAVPKIPGVQSNKFPPSIGLEQFTGFGCNGGGETTRPATIANDHLTWVRGRHTLGFGAEYRALQDKERSEFGESGSFSFSRLNSGLRGINSGSSIASFLLGDVDNASMSILTLPTQYIRQKYLAIYGSDTWKITPKLTLNYGVRWDLSTPSRDKYNNASFIDPNLPNPGAGNLPGSLVFAGNKAGSASLGRPYPEDIFYKGFAPRIGFAYSMTPKTVVRAGYGVFYQLLSYPSWTSGVSPGRDGFNSYVVFSSSDGGITPALLLQNGFTGKTFDRPPFFNLTFDNGKYPGLYRQFGTAKPPYMQQYNLTIEHQFTADFYISSAYVANKGTRIISQLLPLNTLNPSLLSMGSKLYDQFQPGQTSLDGVPIPYAGWVDQMTQCPANVAQALLPYPQFCGGLTALNENAGNSTYHSFQLKAEKRFSHGLWLLSSYTVSKFISSGSDIQAAAFQWGGTNGIMSPFERKRNKSLDNQDVPQTFSLALVYQLPVGSGQRFLNKGGVVNKVVGGWQLTSIFRAQSGIPFYFGSSQCNVPGQFNASCNPAIKPGVNPFAQSMSNFDPSKSLFNPGAFENGDKGGVFNFDLGQGPRVSNVRGFPFHNHDVSLQKTTSITERIKFQFRAELFNIWNWHIFSQGTTWGQGGAFDTNLSSPTFGMVTGAVTNPRNIQLGAKIIF